MSKTSEADIKMPADLQKQILDIVNILSSNGARYLLGITGIPAVGKSTIAQAIKNEVNEQLAGETAIVIPMDGFHLYNQTLHERNLYAIKGAHQTFDAIGFVNLLRQLKESPDEKISCPIFDRRKSHDPIEDAIVVTPKHKLIITEGNYLLLDLPPWDRIRHILNQTWYLETSREVTIQHLMERHLANGKSILEAKQKIASTDKPNADIIERTKEYADQIIYVEH